MTALFMTSALVSVIPISPSVMYPRVFGEFTEVGGGAVVTAEADGVYGEFTVSGGMISPNTKPLSVGNALVGSTTYTVEAGAASWASTADAVAARANILSGTITKVHARRGAFIEYDEVANPTGLAGYAITRPIDIVGDTLPVSDWGGHFSYWQTRGWNGLRKRNLDIGGVGASVPSSSVICRYTSGQSQYPWMDWVLDSVRVRGAAFDPTVDYSVDQAAYDTNILPSLKTAFQTSTGTCGAGRGKILNCSAEYGIYGLQVYAQDVIEVSGFSTQFLFADSLQLGGISGYSDVPVFVTAQIAGDFVTSPPDSGGAGSATGVFHADVQQMQGGNDNFHVEGIFAYRRPGVSAGAQFLFNTGVATQHVFGAATYGRVGNLTSISSPVNAEVTDVAYLGVFDLAGNTGADTFDLLRVDGVTGTGTIQVRNSSYGSVSQQNATQATVTVTNSQTTDGWVEATWDAALASGRGNLPTGLPTIRDLLLLAQPTPAGSLDGKTVYDAFTLPAADALPSTLARKVENTSPVISLAETLIEATQVTATLTTDTAQGTVFWAWVDPAETVSSDASVVYEQMVTHGFSDAGAVYGYKAQFIGSLTNDIIVTGLTTDVAGKLVTVQRRGHNIYSNVQSLGMTPVSVGGVSTVELQASVNYVVYSGGAANLDFGTVPAGTYFLAASNRTGNLAGTTNGPITVNGVTVEEYAPAASFGLGNSRNMLGGYIITLASEYSGTFDFPAHAVRLYGSLSLYNIGSLTPQDVTLGTSDITINPLEGDSVIIWGAQKNEPTVFDAPIIQDNTYSSGGSAFMAAQGHANDLTAGSDFINVGNLSFDDEDYISLLFRN